MILAPVPASNPSTQPTQSASFFKLNHQRRTIIGERRQEKADRCPAPGRQDLLYAAGMDSKIREK